MRIRTFILVLALCWPFCAKADTLAYSGATTIFYGAIDGTEQAEDFSFDYELTSTNGLYDLVPGSLTYNISGPLGVFSLFGDFPRVNFFDFANAAGDDIQIDFANTGRVGDPLSLGLVPGHYSGKVLNLDCHVGVDCLFAGFVQGTAEPGITVSEVPEPAEMLLVCAGMMALSGIKWRHSAAR